MKPPRRPRLWAILAVAASIAVVVTLNMDDLPQLMSGQARLQTLASAAAVAALLVSLGGMVVRRFMR